jgi:hypothetical protein
LLPKPKRILLSLIAGTSCLVTLVLCGTSESIAETIRSSVICRDNITTERRAQLASKLRQITGLSDLRFDSDGTLRLGSRSYSNGSKSARALLAKAVYGPTTIVVEDVSHRPDIAFARVIPGKWRAQAQNSGPVFVVLVDFADFDYLMGDGPALEAFDVGWAFLHELDHVVEDSEDSISHDDVGECEDHLNKMRQECNLPLRADYFHTLFPMSTASQFTTKLVRLSFIQGGSGSGKKKRYWVIWDAAVVGGLDERIAASR